ncbi:MAG: hypothetical protein ACWGNB_03675, partial [Thiogranum sp.]
MIACVTQCSARSFEFVSGDIHGKLLGAQRRRSAALLRACLVKSVLGDMALFGKLLQSLQFLDGKIG